MWNGENCRYVCVLVPVLSINVSYLNSVFNVCSDRTVGVCVLVPIMCGVD